MSNVVAAFVIAACLALAAPSAAGAQVMSPAAQAKADRGRPAYTPADVKFMQGMIHHHAQAVWMASLTSTHGAGNAIRRLAERIDVSQRDEIAYMRRWLGERRERVPDGGARHDMAGHGMAGMPTGAMMPGMLTHEQMMQLDEARGAAFDRLFLTFMIQHHQGALTMVEQLFSSPGAGQDVTVFRFASDVTADQTTEIERMRSMLSASSDTSTSPSTPGPRVDPRVGLRAGWYDAGEAIWNLSVVSKTPPSEQFTNPSTPGDSRLTNSDLAFLGNYVFQGNYSGYQVWDIANPRRPVLRTAFVCPGSQSDVTVYRNLLFVSAEATNGRVDCGMQGVADTVSRERARGIRIFDIGDVANPKHIVTVQTCRGSHTNTLVTDPKDPENAYIYVSGSAGVRSSNELPGCSDRAPDKDPNTALFRIEVIKVPLAHPERAAIVSSPRIFDDLRAPARHGDTPADSAAMAARAAAAGRRLPAEAVPGVSPGPTQCHDITAYPAIGLAGGACAGYGLLLDISDVAHPKRIAAVADSNFSFWHSATFNNDGTKILFSDEWGGGTQPRCRATDKLEWGADAIFTRTGNTLTFQSYYKMPAPQTPFENCVAHNGSLIPIPGRDVMVQSWYQGGISVFDWTDAKHPKEIAFFDRGPMDSTKQVGGGYWSSYWYNGYIVGSEISRGLDIFELQPSAFLTRNEIDAAKSVHFDYFNAQEQPKIVWPATFALARAYLDQLVRDNGLRTERTSAIARDLSMAEQMPRGARGAALTQLASQLDSDASAASDRPKVRLLAAAIRELANVR